MRKILLLILIVFGFCITGCSNKNNDDPVKDDPVEEFNIYDYIGYDCELFDSDNFTIQYNTKANENDPTLKLVSGDICKYGVVKGYDTSAVKKDLNQDSFKNTLASIGHAFEYLFGKKFKGYMHIESYTINKVIVYQTPWTRNKNESFSLGTTTAESCTNTTRSSLTLSGNIGQKNKWGAAASYTYDQVSEETSEFVQSKAQNFSLGLENRDTENYEYSYAFTVNLVVYTVLEFKMGLYSSSFTGNKKTYVYINSDNPNWQTHILARPI